LLINAKSVEAHYGLANIYHTIGRYGVAIAEYEAALRLNPYLLSAQTALGDAYVMNEQYAEAIAQYRTALETKEMQCEAGDQCLEKGNKNEAIALYRVALGLQVDIHPPVKKKSRTSSQWHPLISRRKNERIPMRVPVEIRTENGLACSAESVDVSKHGLLIESEKTIQVGAEIEVVLMPEGEKNTIPLVGRVVRVANPDRPDQQLGIELKSEADDMWGDILGEDNII